MVDLVGTQDIFYFPLYKYSEKQLVSETLRMLNISQTADFVQYYLFKFLFFCESTLQRTFITLLSYRASTS